jgi:hypothetical protein
MNIDNGVVDHCVRLRKLKLWRLKGSLDMPFYLHTGESSLIFNGKPETVRDLLRIYNTRKYDTFIEFVAFLNEEGVEARKVSAPIDKILGYHVELSNN